MKKFLKLIGGITSLILIGKVLAFLRESLISARYGAGFVSDVYVLEDGVVNAINSVFAGVLSSTFIPFYLGIKNRKQRNRYVSDISTVFSMLILLIIGICTLCMGPLLRVLVPGFYKIYDMGYVSFLMKLSLPQLILIFLENVLLALFQAHDVYFYTAIQSVFLNVPLILYLIVGYRFEILGIIVCNLLANAAILILLLHTMRKRKLASYRPVFDLKDRNFRNTIRLSLPVLLVCLLSQFNYVVDRMMSSTLKSGSMALISYATTIGMLAYYILGNAFSMPFYTAVSKAQDNAGLMMKEYKKYTNSMLRLLVPACCALAFFSREVSDVIYGHGKMTPDNVKILSVLVILYLPGTFFYCLRDMLNRVCYAAKNTVIPSASASIGFIANIIFCLVLVRRIGIYGVPLATSLSSGLIFLFLTISIRVQHIFPNKRLRLHPRRIIRLIAMAAALYWGRIAFSLSVGNKWLELVLAGGMFLVAAGIYNLDLLRLYKRKPLRGN